MDTSGYTVSLPDLRGFADQIRSLGPFYADVGRTLSGLGALQAATPTVVPGSGALSGALTKFQHAYFDLLSAEFDAFTRMGKGLTAVADNLADTADAYEKSEHETTSRFDDLRSDTRGELAHDSGTTGKLESTDSVRSGLREAPPTVLDGQPMSDWSARLRKADYFTFGDSSSYMPKMHYSDELGVVKGTLAEAASGDIVGGLDSIIEAAFGFSAVKAFCTPLLGDWQILWVMRDGYADAANAVDAVANLLRGGTRTFANGEWTGAAAAGFGKTIDAWGTVMGGHSNNLRMASDLMGEMGDRLDADATQITTMLEDLVSTLIGIFTGETEVDILVALAQSTAGGYISDVVKTGASLQDATAVCWTNTEELCKTANAIQPPS